MRLRALILCLTASVAAGPLWAAAQSSSPRVAANKAGKASAAKPQAKAGKSTSGKTASAKSRARRLRRPVRRAGQLAPSRERYAQIQEALIERGYSQGPASGIWGPEWAESLKRFQRDHDLEPSGKLNSLTLIALGLGPNRASRSGPAAGDGNGEAAPGRTP